MVGSLSRTHEAGEQIIADAHAGLGPERRKRREEAGTFGAVAAAFMRDYAQSHRTRDEMQRKINVDLTDWHDRPIAEIRRADIKEMIRLKARTAPISANRLRRSSAKFSLGLEGGIDRGLASHAH